MCFAPWNCLFWILNLENLCAGNLPLFAMLFPAPFPASWIFFVISSTSCHYLTDPSRAATTKIHPSLSPQMTAPYGHCTAPCFVTDCLRTAILLQCLWGGSLPAEGSGGSLSEEGPLPGSVSLCMACFLAWWHRTWKIFPFDNSSQPYPVLCPGVGFKLARNRPWFHACQLPLGAGVCVKINESPFR